MELTDKCPFCGGKDCKRSPITEGEWKGTDGLYLQCEKGLQCTIHPSVWYGDQKEVMKRFHQIYLKMKKAPFINNNGQNYKYFFFMKNSLLVRTQIIFKKSMLQN